MYRDDEEDDQSCCCSWRVMDVMMKTGLSDQSWAIVEPVLAAVLACDRVPIRHTHCSNNHSSVPAIGGSTHDQECSIQLSKTKGFTFTNHVL